MAHFIVAFGRLWLSIFCVTLEKSTPLSVTQKIKATIDQKPQLGHNEMCHVNRLIVLKHKNMCQKNSK